MKVELQYENQKSKPHTHRKKILVELLQSLPAEYDAVKYHIMDYDLEKLAHYCRRFYTQTIKLLMLPLIHRRNLEYGDNYLQISDVGRALGIIPKKFHRYDAELIKHGFYNKELILKSRINQIISTAEKEIRKIHTGGYLNQDQVDEVMKVVNKLIRIESVATRKKYLVKILVVISIMLVTEAEMYNVLKLVGGQRNHHLHTKIKLVLSGLSIDYQRIPVIKVPSEKQILEKIDGDFDPRYEGDKLVEIFIREPIDLAGFDSLRKITVSTDQVLTSDCVNKEGLTDLIINEYHPELELVLPDLRKLVLYGIEELDENYMINLPRLKNLDLEGCPLKLSSFAAIGKLSMDCTVVLPKHILIRLRELEKDIREVSPFIRMNLKFKWISVDAIDSINNIINYDYHGRGQSEE